MLSSRWTRIILIRADALVGSKQPPSGDTQPLVAILTTHVSQPSVAHQRKEPEWPLTASNERS
jgi:hypothetical protein